MYASVLCIPCFFGGGVVFMAYLNSSEDVSTVLDVLRIKLCIRSCRLWLFWEQQTHCQLQRFLRSRLTLSLDQWLSTYLACRDTAESGHLYWSRGREREGGLETAVLWRGIAEPARLFRGGLSENVSFISPHLTQLPLLWWCSACFCLLSSPSAVLQKLSACGALISGGL